LGVAARRRAEAVGAVGAEVGAVVPQTIMIEGDTWQAAARDALTVCLRRVELMASCSSDVAELLRVAERVADIVAVAEDIE
jgi:hypothetical protein